MHLKTKLVLLIKKFNILCEYNCEIVKDLPDDIIKHIFCKINDLQTQISFKSINKKFYNELKIDPINFYEHNICVVHPYINFLCDVKSSFFDFERASEKIINETDTYEEYNDYINNLITINYKKYNDYLNKQTNFNENGVIHKYIPKNYRTNLLLAIKEFSSETKADYHPGSNEIVRDIVHPSLYPYIDENYRIRTGTDYWQRPYENSKYQWLPSEFNIDSDGKCKIKSYINNLPECKIEIYTLIEKLFEFVLPEFEHIWSYLNHIDLYLEDTYNYLDNYCLKYNYKSLKNKKLQVITKIVEITDSIEGIWHIEGMSHENIIATASCTLEQLNMDAIIQFKRIYTNTEANVLLYTTHQDVSETYKAHLNELDIPLGTVDIKEGSLIVFPNSHIHKVNITKAAKAAKAAKATKAAKAAKRTIVVFWLINPDKKIVSTKDIPQQNYDIKIAYEHRLQLMNERKFIKNTFNQRDLDLCEH
jgi:hypothetical protein